MAVAKPKAKTKTLGEYVDEMSAVRDQRRDLNAQDKVLEEKYKELETELRAALKAQGLDMASGKTATASFGKPTIVADVKDWDKLWAYIARTKNFQLVQKRVSDPAYRELCEIKGGTLPGCESLEIVKLNLRNKGE